MLISDVQIHLLHNTVACPPDALRHPLGPVVLENGTYPGVQALQLTCSCCVNATVASSFDNSPAAVEEVAVKERRLLMFRMPLVPHGDQIVAVVSTESCLV
jgi:hypothetical protein